MRSEPISASISIPIRCCSQVNSAARLSVAINRDNNHDRSAIIRTITENTWCRNKYRLFYFWNGEYIDWGSEASPAIKIQFQEKTLWELPSALLPDQIRRI